MTDTRVVIVDDQDLFRAGLRMILAAQDGIEVVGEAASGNEALAVVAAHHPDVVLMDIRMPGMDGFEATRAIMQRTARAGARPVQVLVLTTLDSPDATRQALAAGAAGFMLKDTEPEFLAAAVRALAHGTRVVAASSLPETPQPPAAPPAFERLTERELDVFQAVCHGLSNREIAGTLFVSEATVKTHVGSVLNKLGLRDRVQLVVFGYEHALVR